MKITEIIWKPIDKLMGKLPNSISKKVPNIFTTARVLSAVALTTYIPLMGITDPIMLATWMGATGLTDLLDGKFARRYKSESKTGAILDALADKVLNWGVGTVLIISGIVPPWILLILIRDLIVNVQCYKYAKENNSYNEIKEKEFKEFDIIPPTILAKIKMWLQTSGITACILFANIPDVQIVSNILFAGAIGVAAGDIFLVDKKIKEKKLEKEKTLIDNIDYEYQEKTAEDVNKTYSNQKSYSEIKYCQNSNNSISYINNEMKPYVRIRTNK